MAETETWNHYFPGFAKCEDRAIRQLMTSARELRLEAETRVFEPGWSCGNYLLVLEGAVRVYILTPGGREVLLYRVVPGNACTLTTSCLLGADDYPAYGVTETLVRALAVPARDFHQALAQSPFFRNFVFSGFSTQLTRVIVRMEELVEGDIDSQLARLLLSMGAEGHIRKTHQELAIMVGTAREVISRHLKRFESGELVRLGRGTVEITNPDGLRRLAGRDAQRN